MVATGPTFGEELRRRRLESGKSLAAMEHLVHISRSHLSKIERGLRRATPELARSCDAKLHAEGELLRLLPMAAPAPDPGGKPAGSETASWQVRVRATGQTDFTAWNPAGEGDAGQPVVVAHASITPGEDEAGAGEESLAVFQAMFHEYRRLGQCSAPAVVIPMSSTAMTALHGLSRTAPLARRGAVQLLAAQFAEFTGWMWQEAGDDRAARWWTSQASALAAEGGSQEMTAYALVREAEIALYRGDSRATVELAGAAESRARGSRIRELAAHRRAQGHALMGDEYGCRRALERGAELAHDTRREGDIGPYMGGSHLPDLTAFIAAWCSQELDDPQTAVGLLAPGKSDFAPHALRARARHGARLALALAGIGEIEQACEVADGVARDVVTTDSATLRADLRRVQSALAGHRRLPAVQRTLAAIAASMHISAGSRDSL